MNPWVTLLPETQIIGFDPSGNITRETIPDARIVPYRPKKRVTSKKAKHVKDFNEDIAKLTRKIYRKSISQHSTKVFTNCNKQTEICQFVTCPNIKESCFLCSTFMVYPLYDNTECEKINTEYLSLVNVKDTRKENRRRPPPIVYDKLYDK